MDEHPTNLFRPINGQAKISNNIKCQLTQKILGHIDRTLPVEDRAAMIRHFRVCESCNDKKNEMEKILDQIKGRIPVKTLGHNSGEELKGEFKRTLKTIEKNYRKSKSSLKKYYPLFDQIKMLLTTEVSAIGAIKFGIVTLLIGATLKILINY